MFSSETLIGSLLAKQGIYYFSGPPDSQSAENAWLGDPVLEVQTFARCVFGMCSRGEVPLFVGANRVHYQLENEAEVIAMWRTHKIEYGIAVRKDVFDAHRGDIALMRLPVGV